MSATTVYPYIMTLDDGTLRVIVRLPSEGPDRLVAYTLGSIDWSTTVLLNPSVVSDVMTKLLEKLPKKEGA